LRKLLLALLIAVALLSVATVAVALTLTPKKIAGSSTVDVSCPASGTPCSATVGWRLDDNYDVDACIVSWTPTFSGKATVACIVYDDSGTVKASGSISNKDVSNGVAETNTVELSSAVDPHDIYKVEVVIMEEM
jgi:hypothetical protein